jgi:hypothetical protein
MHTKKPEEEAAVAVPRRRRERKDVVAERERERERERSCFQRREMKDAAVGRARVAVGGRPAPSLPCPRRMLPHARQTGEGRR